MDGDSSENHAIISRPFGPKPRNPIGSKSSEVYSNSKHCSKKLHIKSMPQQKQKSVRTYKSDTSSDDSDHDKQMTNNSDEKLDGQKLSRKSRNRSKTTSSEEIDRSRTISPERENNNGKNKSLKNSWKKSPSKRETLQSSTNEQSTNSSFFSITDTRVKLALVLFLLVLYLVSNTLSNNASRNQTESINNKNLLFKHIEDIKIQFYNQDLYIWDEISSGINEVVTRTPKVPSIILLFANETHTMDCLALALADLSNNILGGDSFLNLNPEDFGDDPGEIIHTLKSFSTKKAVIIHDVLNINAEAIKALHNLCDRINPLIREVIYIITMQTKNYELSQHKMAFVEKQLYRKLSKNIDEDILTALVTRITDGAIILVQPEPNLRYC